jgi:hypothetical protein
VELTPQIAGDIAGQDHRQQTVLEAVLVKNVTQARRDHRADAVGAERPHRRLARRAAAEVLSGHDDLRTAKPRPVQNELRLLRAVGVKAHVVEEKARVLRYVTVLAQEARGNHPVGVDVRQVNRHGDGGDAREGLHR